jgi:hypothetical protein
MRDIKGELAQLEHVLRMFEEDFGVSISFAYDSNNRAWVKPEAAFSDLEVVNENGFILRDIAKR